MKDNYVADAAALAPEKNTYYQKHATEAAMVPGSAANLLAAASGGRVGRDSLDVKQWSNLSATPYGHFNRMMARDEKRPKGQPLTSTGQRVLGDHYAPHKTPLQPEPLVR